MIIKLSLIFTTLLIKFFFMSAFSVVSSVGCKCYRDVYFFFFFFFWFKILGWFGITLHLSQSSNRYFTFLLGVGTPLTIQNMCVFISRFFSFSYSFDNQVCKDTISQSTSYHSVFFFL